MKVRVINSGEGEASIVKEITQEQYEFLDNLFDELNDNGLWFAPFIYMYKEEDEKN